MDTSEYAHGEYASKCRLQKAEALARWLWAQGVTAAQQDMWSDDEWTRVARVAVGKTASDDTRRIVYALLIHKEAWAAANPRHEAARRSVLTDEQAKTLAAPRRRRADSQPAER